MRLPVMIGVMLLLVVLSCRPAGALELFDFNFPWFPGTQKSESIDIDTDDLEHFLDNFFDREMARLNVPGAVFSMVQDGELIFCKGYGYADPAEQSPADPKKSLFRVASISKLFTATAAMQLYEQGLLDLNEDVNYYLDSFQLPETFEKPVTTAHLLTHTGGFDDRSVNLAFNRADRVPSLENYLAANMPPRVMPPGETISYSNHGSGLAGLVIEKISGQDFVDYANRHILEPLGMKRSSFLLPPELAPDLAAGHFVVGGHNQPRAFDFLYNIAPAASLNTTAEDMGRFMIAHIQGGRLERSRILQESTMEEMHSQQFTHHPDLAGVTYGFFERYANNRRFIHHSGLWGGFASLVFLYPEGDLGFFVSANSGAGTELHGNLASELVDYFLPAVKAAAGPASEPFQSEAGACHGSYRPVRHSRHTLEKIAVLAAQCRAADLGEGAMALEFSSWSGHQPLHWEEAEPFFFRQAEGEDGLAFRRDEQGKVTHMFMGAVAMERLAWYEDAALHRAAGIIFLGLFLSAWLGWPLLRILRRRRGAGAGNGWRLRLPAAVAAMLNTVFLVGFVYFVVTRPDTLIYGIPPVVVFMLILPLLAAALALSTAWMAVAAWRNGYWTLAGRLHYTLVSLSLLLFIPYLHYWNLLGFRF